MPYRNNMKKPIIIVVVLLAAALAALKYYSSKSQEAVTAPPAGQATQETQGVALPAGATEYAVPSGSEYVYVPSPGQGTYDSLTLPSPALALKGACEGGSIRDIIAEHGKSWGYFTGRRYAIGPEKSRDLYALIGDYYACLAASRQDVTFCNDLPGDAEQNGLRVELADSPLGFCREKAGLFLFRAYVAGKAPDRGNCLGFIATWHGRDQNRISAQDLCAAAAKGPAALTEYSRSKLGDMAVKGEKIMAFSRGVCGSDPACLANNGVWEGVRTGDARKCPENFRPHCSALAQKNQAPCVDILEALSRKYCSYTKNLRAGGMLGMTEEEVSEQVRQEKEKKAAEERQRKEMDAITQQVNTRIKQISGGQGD